MSTTPAPGAERSTSPVEATPTRATVEARALAATIDRLLAAKWAETNVGAVLVMEAGRLAGMSET